MSAFLPNRQTGLGSYLLRMLEYEECPTGVPVYQVRNPLTTKKL